MARRWVDSSPQLSLAFGEGWQQACREHARWVSKTSFLGSKLAVCAHCGCCESAALVHIGKPSTGGGLRFQRTSPLSTPKPHATDRSALRTTQTPEGNKAYACNKCSGKHGLEKFGLAPFTFTTPRRICGTC